MIHSLDRIYLHHLYRTSEAGYFGAAISARPFRRRRRFGAGRLGAALFRGQDVLTRPTVIVIVISSFLKRYLKAKRTRAPACSRALRRVKRSFPKGGRENTRRDRVAIKVGVIQLEKVNAQMGQSRSVWRDETLILSGRPDGWRIEEADEDDVLWLAMTVAEVKKWWEVQVVGHSKDVVQWWIWLG